MPVTNESYVARLLRCGRTPEQIAVRMNLSLEEVNTLVSQIQQSATLLNTSRMDEVAQAFLVLCNQYQLVGESLKVIGSVLGSNLSMAQLEELVADDKATTLARLREVIVLRPPPEALRALLPPFPAVDGERS